MLDGTSVNNTGRNFFLNCQNSTISMVVYTFYTLVCVLFLLPLSILIFYMGFKKWMRQRSTSALIHADVLTYHSVVVQVICVFGALFYCVGAYSQSSTVTMLGVYLSCISLPTEPFLETLTCVDLYLAVVFPIQYTLHRDSHGVTIRNICITLVWLCGFGWIGVTKAYLPHFATLPLSIATATFMGVIMFCGVSVVCVLKSSGPTEEGGSKGRIDQRKLRALQIIMSITGVLLLRNLSNVLVSSFETAIEELVFCVLMDFTVLITIPSSLILPSLFLHREGKLKFCQKTVKQEGK